MQNDLTRLLGAQLDEVANSAFVRSLNEQPKTELIEDRFYMQFQECGVAFDADLDGRVSSIFFYSDGQDGYRGFAGRLPEGISFSSCRSDVRKKLGAPSASGGGAVIQFLGEVDAWDAFDRDSYSLHIQYAKGEDAINLVTLMRPDAVPR